MLSVVFTAVLSGLGRIAGGVVELLDQLPQHERFELSQDGESVYSGSDSYDFVGFSDDGCYTAPSGERAVPGKRLGYVSGDSYRVRQLDGLSSDYIILFGVGDCAEIYRHRT